ncbi:hypothetical protein [Streptomyces sp. NPDC004065]|uniref:hypothetical protein n=1 Tax=Streptomyces sp. NPDC004065 TaxID=3364689 RepID=UPI0038500412
MSTAPYARRTPRRSVRPRLLVPLLVLLALLVPGVAAQAPTAPTATATALAGGTGNAPAEQDPLDTAPDPSGRTAGPARTTPRPAPPHRTAPAARPAPADPVPPPHLPQPVHTLRRVVLRC